MDDRKEFVEESFWTTEKVTTCEEVDKGPEKLDNMKEALVTIRRKDLYDKKDAVAMMPL